MSQYNNARESRWDTPVTIEDADRQLALRLSEELNQGYIPPFHTTSTQQPDHDADADYALALKLQFDNANNALIDCRYASASNSGRPLQTDGLPTEAAPCATKGKEPDHAIYHSETPGAKRFKTLHELTHSIRVMKCSGCSHQFFRSDYDVTIMLENWAHKSTPLTSLLKCQRCLRECCVACTPKPFSKPSLIVTQGKQVSWCCAGGRLFVIWLLLCGFDRQFSARRPKQAKKSKPKSRPKSDTKRNSTQQTQGGGVGYGGSFRASPPYTAQMPSGLGYGGDEFSSQHYPAGYFDTFRGGQHGQKAPCIKDPHKARALGEQLFEDIFNVLHLQFLDGLLPAFERQQKLELSSFDFDPPEALVELLLESKLLSYCAELLRNDSLDDATKRMSLYQALIALTNRLGSHCATASHTIYDERLLREDGLNRLELSFQQATRKPKEKCSSLFSCLSNLNTQSELVLAGAKSNEAEFQTRDGQDFLLLCRQISDLHEHLTMNSTTPSNTQSAKSESAVPGLVDVPDVEIMATHVYAQVAKGLHHVEPGRFRHLMTQITTLKTGLPPGIFIRYAESRPDVQKVAIIGPVGTPYENGIFEFDIFCGGGFPAKAPMVQFKTTGGGRVTFNPNLYADGKVCLSLLGTWQGEPWIPGESTLLQVVISIQAMILCEEPWYNEPGRESRYRRGSDKSPAASYNQTIRQHTVRTAILPWLEKTPPLWKDVVDQHFKANADKILQTAVEWSKSKVKPYAMFADLDDELDDYHPKFMDKGYFKSLSSSVAPPPPPPPSHQNLSELETMLPRLQSGLLKYGVRKIVTKTSVCVSKRPLSAPTTTPSMAPQHYMVPGHIWTAASPYTLAPPMPQPVTSPYASLPPPPLPQPPTASNPSYHGYAGFTGMGGNVSGSIEQQLGPSFSSSSTNHRGGPASRGTPGSHNRYETRSSTQDFGGYVPTPHPNLFANGGMTEALWSSRGNPFATGPGRGAPSQGRGRGGGGRGGRGGYNA